MENIVTLSKESIEQGGFYIPQSEVKIEGVGLPKDVLRDVIQLTYKDNIKEIDSFELTVNNWDPTTNTFKYVGAETAALLKSVKLFTIFEPSNKEVTVSMGYLDNMRVMLTGNFTTMAPSFPSGGAPTLSVRGLNILHQFRGKQNTRTWEKEKDSRIIKSIEPDFPIPIEIDDNAVSGEPELEFLAQRSKYDVDFIFTRARERGYVVFIQEEDKEVRGSKKRLYFGPSQSKSGPGLRDVTFKLEWGKSLIDFNPTLTTANQVKSVTVKGWDRNLRSPISETVDLNNKKLNRNKDLFEVIEKSNPREEVVVDEPIFNKGQAKERALAILMDKQKEMVKASGTTIGLPDLRAGKKIVIDNLGSRFSGTYFVTETTHTINDSGYITKFNARREAEEGDNKK